MAPDGEREHDALARARSAGSWLAGMLLLGLLVTALVGVSVELWRRLDVDQMVGSSRSGVADSVELPPSDSVAPPVAVAAGSFTVALLRNRQSARFYPDSTFYGSAVEGWRSRASALGAEVRTARTAADLRALPPGAVVVAPATLCLPVDAGLALNGHVEGGGSVVAAGPVGVRDADCGWRGWEFLESLTGARAIRELDERSGLYLTVPGGLPLSPGLEPGTRVEMRYARQLAAVYGGALPYWSDWGLSPAPARPTEGAEAGPGSRPVSAASLHATDGGGRVAWLGFHPAHAARGRDRVQARRLARNALAWAAGLPVATLAPWPGGARAGMVLAQEVESRPDNARVLAGVAGERGVPATFFVASRLMPGNSDLAERLQAVGEIGTQTADHRPLGGRDAEVQRLALATSRTEVQQWAGVSPVGLSPPEERVDRTTISAWREVGGRYVLTTNDARRASPEVFRVEEGPVVLLPRVVPDDYTLYVDRGMSRGAMLRPLVRSLEKVRKLRGLATPTFHTPLAGLESRPLIRGVVDSARAMGDWWWATGREAARWWLARAGTRISLEAPGGPSGATGAGSDDRPELRARLRAPEDRPLVDARLRLYPSPASAGDTASSWRAAADGRPLPVGSGPRAVEVTVDSLAAGDSTVIELSRTGR